MSAPEAFATLLGVAGIALALSLALVVRRLRIANADRDRLENERRVALAFLKRIGEAMTLTDDLDALLRMIVHFAIEATSAEGGALFVLYPRQRVLAARITEGTFPPLKRPSHTTFTKILSKARYIEEALRRTPYPCDEGVLGEAVTQRRTVLIEDAEKDDRLPLYEEPELHLRTLLAAPLIFHEEVLGVLAVSNKRTLGPFNESDRSLLASLADQAALSVRAARLYQAAAEKERIDRDLRLASDIQQILIPRRLPERPGLDCAGLSEPAQQVGGDYYDMFELDDARIAFAIADVSGKGVSAALVMAMFRATVRLLATASDSPAAVLRETNRRIFPDIRDDMFVSVVYGIIDTRSWTVAFARAGHEPPLLRRVSGTVEIVSPPGMAVGIDPGEAFDQATGEGEIRLSKGDLLVLYTDGITEARDRAGTEYGRDNLLEAVATSGSDGAANLARDIRERMRRFVGDTPQQDDITLLILGAGDRGGDGEAR